MKLKLVNSEMVFSKTEYQEIQVSTTGKQNCFYKNDGSVATNDEPETYQHQEFTFEPITAAGYALLNNSSVINVNYGIVVLFSDDTIIKVYTVDEVGKTFNNLKIKLPSGVNKIGISVHKNGTCDAKVYNAITE